MAAPVPSCAGRSSGFSGNFLLAGSDAGCEILANAMTIIETAKLAGLNPETYLADLLARIRQYDQARLDDLLPWNWKHPPGPRPKQREDGLERPLTTLTGIRPLHRTPRGGEWLVSAPHDRHGPVQRMAGVRPSNRA
jgi:hypothetical protein